MKLEKRHKKESSGPELYMEADAETLEKHIIENFGSFENVFHELPSSDIRVDIAIVDPTPERNFYTLVTMGMGAHRMNIPPELAEEKLECAELMMCLPPEWKFDEEDDIWYWPIYWLKYLARLPGKQDTWLGWGHTVSNNGPFAENTDLSGCILATPYCFEQEASVCTLRDGNEINFYQVIPIHDGELDFACEDGAEALFELLDPDDVCVSDICRESVCEETSHEENTVPLSERAEQFWKWFSENEETLSQITEDLEYGSREKAVAFVNEGISLIYEEIYFNMGGKHEFNFAVSGDPSLFYVLPYLISKMPDEYKDKWTFAPYTRGTKGESFSMHMYDTDIEAKEVMVSLKDSPEGGKFILYYYNEKLSVLEEKKNESFFYTLMAIIVGDLLRHVFITGAISLDGPAEGMFPLTELEGRLTDIASKSGKVPEPSELSVPYELEPDDSDELRFDVSSGITCYPELIRDYYLGDPTSYYEMSKYGAKFITVFFSVEGMEQTALDKECMMIADAVEKTILGKKGSGDEIGITIGHAIGEKYGYIDLLLYDEDEFYSKIMTALMPFSHIFFLSDLVPSGGVFHIGNGNGTDLIREIDSLHKNNKHSWILSIIDKIHPSLRDYHIAGRYARALNNTDNYEEALQTLMGLENEGKNDPIWYYRVGYSLFYLDREAEAVGYLQKSIEIGGEDEDARELLDICFSILNADDEDEEEEGDTE